MAANLPPTAIGGADGCCVPSCSSVYVTQVPGPPGRSAPPCEPCENGADAFTQLTSGFTMPESCGEVLVEVLDSSWMVPGQYVFVEFAGTFLVVSKPDSTHAVLRNLQNCGASSTYFDNSPPTTPIPSGSSVSPAGQQGPPAVLPEDLFDLSSPTIQKGDLIVDDGANSPDAHDVRHPVGTDGETLHANSSTSDGVKWEKVDLSADAQVTDELEITHGGTGKANKTDAFNALSPLTTRGDIIFRGVTDNERRSVGNVGSVLTSDGTEPQWEMPPFGGNAEADGSGTDYDLSNSYAPVIFGTGQLDMALTEDGTYLLLAVLTFHANAGNDCAFKFRDTTNNADVPNSEIIVDRGDSVDRQQAILMSILSGVTAPITIQVWGYNSASSNGAVYATLSKSIFVKLAS